MSPCSKRGSMQAPVAKCCEGLSFRSRSGAAQVAAVNASAAGISLTDGEYRGRLGPVKQELHHDEINFSALAGSPADGPVPGALLSPGAEPEGHRQDARRLRRHRLAAAQARDGRGA